ncbi:extracellular ligand-binding receptor [Sulfuricella denitrificans skB26]|uniref:Extracellular ligand-binding receptor n=1 Tax=Sulfuricella denitrificans (strain DSM 22764 / NBRC 105220 / skB26) TaxID=1163617 RepID=S6AE97_SULDS|nr:urea ABC transporter substrate-binding protein [Sulfuricella denitrificans]BAN34071.1 extracellular ligand-binding receptor [Sulfuricella denitrificans skB26]
MKFNRLFLVGRIVLVILVIYALITWWQQSAPPPNIRIGVLHSLTGTMAASEKPLVNTLRLAIEEANAAGGIMGQKIEAVVVDCRSDSTYCAQQAERLITEEKVSALFGCWTSACRKAVKPVVEKHHHLLFYPVQYEGMEMSPNIIYTGAAPNQQIIPGVHWALENLGKRVYLVGSDYVFPRMANIIIKDLLTAQGAVLTGERYLPLGESAMETVVADIARQRPDVVLNTLNGDSNAHFFAALGKAGLAHLPLVSFSVTEATMKAWGGAQLSQHYAVWSYFQSLPGEKNRRFVAAFQARLGADRMTDDPMEAAYIGLHLWVQAAREAGSAEPAKVQRTILRQTLNAPEGMVAIDPDTRHLWKTPRIGKVRPDGQFDIVWDAGQALEPAPFPSYRFRDEWLQLLQSAEGAQP